MSEKEHKEGIVETKTELNQRGQIRKGNMEKKKKTPEAKKLNVKRKYKRKNTDK